MAKVVKLNKEMAKRKKWPKGGTSLKIGVYDISAFGFIAEEKRKSGRYVVAIFGILPDLRSSTDGDSLGKFYLQTKAATTFSTLPRWRGPHIITSNSTNSAITSIID